MKAAYYEKYGSADVVSLREMSEPSVGKDELLVEIYSTSVTTADWRLRASAFPAAFWLPGRLMFGLFAPKNKILGGDFAGRVVAKGDGAHRFKIGDEVFGYSGHGAHAQFLTVPEDSAVARKPESIDFDEAAAVPFGALAALVFLRDFAKIGQDQRILIYGASGGVGVFAVQLAKHFGAEVTGVCSAANADFVRSIGADHVIDYTSEDFTRSGATYDVILDTVGKTTFSRCKRALSENGIYIPLEFGLREIMQSLLTSLTGGRKVVIGVSGDTREDLDIIRELLTSGNIKPVIDSHYSLDQIGGAYRRVESRHKTGSVVVTVAEQQMVRQAAE